MDKKKKKKKSFESIGLSVLKQFKTNFEDGSHTGYEIKTNLAILDLRVTQILPTKFQVRWPFGSGEEVQNRLPI